MPESKRETKRILVFGRMKFSSKEQVTEGVTIARAAVRLSVKNAILMQVLGRGGVFVATDFVPVAQEALMQLAHQSEHEGKRARLQMKLAARRHEDPDSSHDYSSLDVSNLKRRSKQALRLAEVLSDNAQQIDYLLDLVEEAREAAWAEVERNLGHALDFASDSPDAEADYDKSKAVRIQNLQLVDLPRLAARKRSAARVREEIATSEGLDSHISKS